jgi:HK97 family phage prohead protease
MSEHETPAPPRDMLVRSANHSSFELRDAEDGGMPTLHGHFAVFDQWTEIDSVYEGRFMERIAPGAFAKTIAENRSSMRILFQHGRDAQIGDKPLAPIEELGEDERGGYYAGRLFDTSYNRDLIPGLKAGVYGASFRFGVRREEFERNTKKSDYNPHGLPERTIREAVLMEFGPVTFPAYEGATAGLRSTTDEFVLGAYLREPERFLALLERSGIALPRVGAGESHSDEGRSEADTPPAVKPRMDDATWRSFLIPSKENPEWV